MNSETHSTDSVQACQSCKQNFIVEPEDFEFYKKIDVPPPTWCPLCRNMRREAWRESHLLYRNTCKLCGKSVVGIHPAEDRFVVYCRECWYSDKWDSLDYGLDYDFNKPFFLQYRELMEAVPRPAMTGTSIVNSDFSHACVSCKNCYYTFWSLFSEDSQNCFALLFSRNAYDSYVTDNSDHAYETLHCNRLYKVRFGYFADNCFDSSFLFDCVGCSDCFGCVNIRKQKYCIFNKKLSKDEYLKQMEYWDLGSYKRLEEAKEKFRALYLSLPRRYAHIINSQNVTGDIIRDSKNCKSCFSALDDVQNCKYLFFGGLSLKDSYDVTGGGDMSELMYEIFGVTRSQRVFLSAGGGNSQDAAYCNWIENSSMLFGCIRLKNKKYCILNKQYAKEEYENLLPKIKKHMDEMPYMDKKGRVYKYGEFFPTELSAYPFNDSWAFTFSPKTKEEVISEGWKWREPQEHSYKISLEPENLPDHIRDVSDDVLKEIIGCIHKGGCNERCTSAFRLTSEELAFYRKMNVALPRLCPNCRYSQRLQWRNGYNLWRRSCMCEGKQSTNGKSRMSYTNTSVHFHGDGSCPSEFETTFSPEKPEIIYCDQCYKAEFL
ncbi:MAG: hypothetical protein HY432_00780 [Candidatus Liptonbacteria bacterium]|nr:hypothetical protein [Candidatus Liptonbacteria bacterium]